MASTRSEAPVLLFLHGVGEGDPTGRWRATLESALPGVGYPGLSDVRVISPWYADALREPGEKVRMPGTTVGKLRKEALDAHRRDLVQRTAAMEQMLGRHVRGQDAPLATAVVNAAVGSPGFGQAQNYLKDEGVRAQVLTRILGELPESGRIVIVGHSLGSVIAADLLSRLPAGLEVAGLVTLGSPLANAHFDVGALHGQLRNPPANLAWWVNLWSASDPVAALRGVSSVFPWVLDLKVPTSLLPGPSHSSRAYLGTAAAATAVGYALFGSRSREIVLASTGVDITLDPQERTGLQALRYAHLISERLDREQAERYRGALRLVQAAVIADIRVRAHRNNRPLPLAVQDLEPDLTSSGLPVPPASRHLSQEEAVVPLITLAEQNLLAPFEIDVDRKVRIEAMEDLTAGMGLGSSLGSSVFEALDEATRGLEGKRAIRWVKWGTVAIGTLALALATGGLALAAAPGLAGAAAVTSALAGFGPGGMIGGLVTAGTLVSAGTTGIAVGVLSPGTSPESVEALVKSQLAVVILRAKLHLEPDPTIWMSLAEMERMLHRERTLLAPYSDEKAEVITALDRKLAAVTAALNHMGTDST